MLLDEVSRVAALFHSFAQLLLWGHLPPLIRLRTAEEFVWLAKLLDTQLQILLVVETFWAGAQVPRVGVRIQLIAAVLLLLAQGAREELVRLIRVGLLHHGLRIDHIHVMNADELTLVLKLGKIPLLRSLVRICHI